MGLPLQIFGKVRKALAGAPSPFTYFSVLVIL
jgi:hypothetical protein